MKVKKMVKNRRTQRRKENSGSVGDYLNFFAILILIISLLGGGIYVFLNQEQKFNTNTADLCPIDGARATVAILLDKTDEIASVTKRDIQNRTSKLLNELPRYYRVSLYTLNEDGLDANPVATLCNPGKLDEMGKLERDGYTANPQMIEDKYTKFKQNMSKAIDQTLGQKFDAKQSPLLSSLQNLSLLLPIPVSLDEEKYLAGSNKIIFISDLLEHTPVFSMYDRNSNLDTFQRSKAGEKFGKKYDEDIDIWQVQRSSSGLTYKELQDLWAVIFRKELGYPKVKVLTLLGEM
jgi:hypothetical protein